MRSNERLLFLDEVGQNVSNRLAVPLDFDPHSSVKRRVAFVSVETSQVRIGDFIEQSPHLMTRTWENIRNASFPVTRSSGEVEAMIYENRAPNPL